MVRSLTTLLFGIIALSACGDNKDTPVDAPDHHDDAPPDACVPGAGPQLAMLTSGDLTIPSAQQFEIAPMMPAMDRSIVFTSIRESEPSPRNGGVVCDLVAADATAGTPAGLKCKRPTMGTDSTTSTGDIHVRWTVATFSAGVTVQRGHADTNQGNPATITLSPAIDPAKSFVVLGGSYAGGTGWSSNDFTRAVITDGTHLEIKHGAIGAEVSWQVVTMTGASVQRGTATMTTTDTTATATATTAAGASSILLASYNTDNASGIIASAELVRAQASGTTLTFTRDMGGAAIDLAWELVTLPLTVHSGVTSFAAGELMKTETVAGLKAANSVALGSSIAILGQSTGSTAYAGTDIDLVGEGAATMTVADGSVVLQRQTGSAAATIPWATMSFAADCP